MIRGLIEQFRFRCHLWWRERRQDYVAQPGDHPAGNPTPEDSILVTESIPRFLFRSLSVYFGVIVVAALLVWLLVAVAPGIASVARIIFLFLLCLWTLFNVFATVGLYKARKAYRSAASRP
jgi:hypothetical protein